MKNKRLGLTLSNDLEKYITEQAKTMGVSKLDYIRFIIMKDKENKK